MVKLGCMRNTVSGGGYWPVKVNLGEAALISVEYFILLKYSTSTRGRDVFQVRWLHVTGCALLYQVRGCLWYVSNNSILFFQKVKKCIDIKSVSVIIKD